MCPPETWVAHRGQRGGSSGVNDDPGESPLWVLGWWTWGARGGHRGGCSGDQADRERHRGGYLGTCRAWGESPLWVLCGQREPVGITILGPMGRTHRRGSLVWVLRSPWGHAGGHWCRFYGAPGVLPGVTGVCPMGYQDARRGSSGWVLWGARGPARGHWAGSYGVPGCSQWSRGGFYEAPEDLPGIPRLNTPGHPVARQGSPWWVLRGAWGLSEGLRCVCYGAPGCQPGVT